MKKTSEQILEYRNYFLNDAVLEVKSFNYMVFSLRILIKTEKVLFSLSTVVSDLKHLQGSKIGTTQ